MDVRTVFPCRSARLAPLLANVALLSLLAGCKWVRFTWGDEEPPPRDPSLGPSPAQLWEDGYGYDNPNGPLIRSGKKKQGEKPNKKTNPFYEIDRDERRNQKPKPEFQVVEPTFDFD